MMGHSVWISTGELHPKHSNGTVKLPTITNNIQIITAPLLKSFDDKTDHRLLYRRLGVCANDVKEDSGVFQLKYVLLITKHWKETESFRALCSKCAGSSAQTPFSRG